MLAECGRSGDADNWYQKGCAEQVQMWFVERLHLVGVIGLVVAFLQVRVTHNYYFFAWSLLTHHLYSFK